MSSPPTAPAATSGALTAYAPRSTRPSTHWETATTTTPRRAPPASAARRPASPAGPAPARGGGHDDAAAAGPLGRRGEQLGVAVGRVPGAVGLDHEAGGGGRGGGAQQLGRHAGVEAHEPHRRGERVRQRHRPGGGRAQ